MKRDDIDLLKKTSRGDLQAFESLYNHYSAMVSSIALRILGNEEEAGDVTQEEFITLHRKADSIHGS